MRVLWITNIMLPPLCEALKLKASSFGGWMVSSLNQLKNQVDVEIGVATFDNRRELYDKTIGGVRYFLIPTRGKNPQHYHSHFEKEWKEVNRRFNPDVVHIHGTELAHGLAWVRANGAENVCVSIQGLVSVIERYYKTDSWLDHIPLTFRDLVKLDWISRQRHNFRERGENEKELILSVNHIIGRTEWDKTHVWAINPKAKYHHCGETLREEFYKHKWQYKDCEQHSIFVSQGNYPIKGLHKLLAAMPLVLREFPDTKIYVGGFNIISAPWYRKTSYAVIIKRLIKKYNLEGKVIYTGMLDEKQMCQQYLKSNIFVLPSAIENSPNSLGEAQLLGIPFVTSYVGGVPDFVSSIPSTMYRYDEVEILAKKICMIFSKDTIFSSTHHPLLDLYNQETNSRTLLSIYSKI